jgi:hypothetical protein
VCSSDLPSEQEQVEALAAFEKVQGKFTPPREELLKMFAFYYKHIAHPVKNLEKELNCGFCRQRVVAFFNTKTKRNDD